MRAGILLLIALTGCATGWVPTQGQYRDEDYGVELTLPEGWMQLQRGNVVIASRNGFPLERIRINRIPLGEPLPNLNRKLTADMLPQDLAELSANSLRLTEGVTNHEVLLSEPAEVGGQSCYRMEYEFRAQAALKIKSREYGCLVGGYLYSIEFIAPAQHYYDAYLEDFEAVRATMRFTQGA
jgi:hypothetical protein